LACPFYVAEQLGRGRSDDAEVGARQLEPLDRRGVDGTRQHHQHRVPE
jgi:hypothetical protein